MSSPHSPSCPWCKQEIELLPNASWAHMKSEAVMHVVNCEKRPANSSAEDLNDTVDTIMNACKRPK